MNWFWFALIALICWSGSDLFSKIGCCGEKDKTAHLKMVVAVGLVMGLHAAYMIVFPSRLRHLGRRLDVPAVSLLYILSMTLGYVGLRYIELSISSPICNSSGALVAVLCLCTGALSDYNGPQKAVILCAVGLVCLGVVGLGVVEAREDDRSAPPPSGACKPQVCQELACHLPARGLLPARRRRDVCRQPRARTPERGLRERRL